jgi:parallel beta-helix repeat protein
MKKILLHAQSALATSARSAILFFAALILLAPLTFASTTVSGSITSDTTWTSSGSPYLVSGINVNTGVTLTINPGVVVKIADSSYMVISGSIIAEGTSSNPIYFTSQQDDTLGGDSNGDGSATSPASVDWNYISISSGAIASFDHAHFYYGGYRYSSTFWGEIITYSDDTTISNSSFNEIDSNTTGITVYSASPSISNTSFSGAASSGYGIRVEGSSSNLIVDGLDFQDLDVGIYFEDSSGGSITNSNFTDVETGIYDYSYPDPSTLTVDSSTFDGGTYGINSTTSYTSLTVSNSDFQNFIYYPIYAGFSSGNFPVLDGNSASGNTYDMAYLSGSIESDVEITGDEGIDIFLQSSIEESATLTLSSGVNLYLTGSMTIYGTLDAQGTESDPITIQPYISTSYFSLRFEDGSTGNLDHLDLEKGGDYYYSYNRGALHILSDDVTASNMSFTAPNENVSVIIIDDASPTLENISIEGAGMPMKGLEVMGEDADPIVTNLEVTESDYGVYLTEGASLTLEGGTITDSSNQGIYLAGTSTISVHADISNISISDNGSDGLYSRYATGSITDNTFTDNADHPIYLDSISEDGAPSISGNTGSGNGDSTMVLASGVYADWTLDADEDFDLELVGLSVQEGATLTFEEGMTLYMSDNSTFTNYGTLNFEGTEASPITLTTVNAHSDSSTTPQAGDWYGVYYYSGGSGGTVENVNFEYAGYIYRSTYYGSLTIASDDVTVSNVDISYPYYYGIYINGSNIDTSKAPILDNISINCDAENFYAFYINGTDVNTKLSNINIEDCYYGIRGTGSYELSDSEITAEDSAIHMNDVDGESVIFSNVTIEGAVSISDPLSASFDNFHVSNSDSYGLYLHDIEDVEITNSSMTNSIYSGLYLNSITSINVDELLITRSGQYGIYADELEEMTFTDLEITDGADYALYLNDFSSDLPLADELTMSGNLNNAVLLTGGPIEDIILTSEQAPLVIEAITIDLDQTFTIEEGTVLKFTNETYTNINSNGTLNIEGTEENPVVITSIYDDEYGEDLNEDGGAQAPAESDWGSLYLSGPSQIEHLIVSYGGSYYSPVEVVHEDVSIDHLTLSNSQGGSGMLNINSQAPALSNINITCPDKSSSSRKGLQMEGSSSVTVGPEMSEVSIEGCYYGIYNTDYYSEAMPFTLDGGTFSNNTYPIYSSQVEEPIIIENIVIENDEECNYGLYLHEESTHISSANHEFSGLDISGCNYGIHMGYGSVDITDSDFSENDIPLYLYGTNLETVENLTFEDNRVNSPYYEGVFDFDLSFSPDDEHLPVFGNVQIESTGSLTLEPGTIIKFDDEASYGQVTIEGDLIAEGTEEDEIIFTSLKDDTYGGDTNGDAFGSFPQKGDWMQIYLTGSADATISHSRIQYGGDTGYYGTSLFHNSSGDLTLSNSTISESDGDMVTIYGDIDFSDNHFIAQSSGSQTCVEVLNNSVDATFTDNQFEDCYYGIRTDQFSTIEAHGNSFISNSYGIYSSATGTVDAERNWWGAATGPGGDASDVYGSVTSAPWLKGFEDLEDVTITSTDADHWNKEITLNWTQPTDTRHLVISRDNGASVQVLDAQYSGLTFTDDAVDYGVDYTYNIYVYNNDELQSLGISSDPLTLADPMPLNFSATAGTGEVSFAWDAPADIDSADIGGYQIVSGSSPVNLPGTDDLGNVTSATLTGLTSGTSYFFSIQSYNSDASLYSDQVTPLKVTVL